MGRCRSYRPHYCCRHLSCCPSLRLATLGDDVSGPDVSDQQVSDGSTMRISRSHTFLFGQKGVTGQQTKTCRSYKREVMLRKVITFPGLRDTSTLAEI